MYDVTTTYVTKNIKRKRNGFLKNHKKLKHYFFFSKNAYTHPYLTEKLVIVATSNKIKQK